MIQLGSAELPLRVAIVGSGPSGFYAAEALLKSPLTIQVDMFDRLPSPYGLVRLGVAPDHEKIKTVIRVYEKIAGHEAFSFFGNVMIGRDLSVDELREFYDAVIFAHGAETDRRLNIPGEDLPGSHTATEFVGWYNGHPDYRDRTFDLSQETAVVIGQGNVAVDVCRILCKTVDELKHTDIAQYALEALAQSKVRDVYMIGRRGPVQAKFTLQEVKELGKLADADPIVKPEDMVLDPLSQREHEDNADSLSGKIITVLEEFSRRPAPAKSRRLHFDFLLSPVEIQGKDNVEAIVLEKNVLSGEPGALSARGTGQRSVLPCGLVFRSVGYSGVPLPGLPFDEKRGLVPNDAGRVLDPSSRQPINGLYVAGWIKRGPSGVIGTNKPDSHATVAQILTDREQLHLAATRNSKVILERLQHRGRHIVSFHEWKSIDAAEVQRGQELGKPREKFSKVQDMLDLLDTLPQGTA